MLDLPSRTAFELHHEIVALKRTVGSLKARVRELEIQTSSPIITTRPRIRDILLLVAEISGQSPMSIIGDTRSKTIMRPRQVICWVARRFTRHSLTDIARSLDRDHTTVLHSVTRLDQVAAWLARCPVQDTPEAWTELFLSVDPWPPRGTPHDP